MDKKIDVNAAHDFSFRNSESIIKSENCGCFHCLEIFPASEITEFVEDKNKNTAICPKCQTDSIICDHDIDFDKEFLQQMHDKWFNN